MQTNFHELVVRLSFLSMFEIDSISVGKTKFNRSQVGDLLVVVVRTDAIVFVSLHKRRGEINRPLHTETQTRDKACILKIMVRAPKTRPDSDQPNEDSAIMHSQRNVLHPSKCDCALEQLKFGKPKLFDIFPKLRAEDRHNYPKGKKELEIFIHSGRSRAGAKSAYLQTVNSIDNPLEKPFVEHKLQHYCLFQDTREHILPNGIGLETQVIRFTPTFM